MTPAMSPCPVLLERDSELATLAAAADVVRSSRARMVLITGEAGAGKTRLWSEFTAQLPAEWALELTGAHATDRSFTAPFAGLVGDVPEDEEPSRALAAALARALRPTDPSRPRALVVEDLHFLDPVGLAALPHALTLLRDASVLVLGTFRLGSHPVGSPHSRALADVLRHPYAGELRLGPLTPTGVAEMAQLMGGLDPAGCEALYERTAGNPLYVEELLRGGGNRLPWTLQEAVASQIDGLTPDAAALARLLALASEPVPFPVLAHVPAGNGDAIRRLLDGGLALEAAGGLCLRHALVAEALSTRLDPDTRRAGHRQLAEAYEESGGASPEALARHWAEAGDAMRAAPHATVAADRLSGARSYATAVDLYRVALAAPPTDAAARAALFERAATAAAVAEHGELAGSWGALAQVARVASGTRWAATGTWGNPVYQRVVHQSVRATASDDVAVAITRAQDLVQSGDYEAASAAAIEAGRAAAEAGDWALESDAALALFYAGAVDDAVSAFEHLAAMAAEAGDTAIEATSLGRHARIELARGDYRRAVVLQRASVTAARRSGITDMWVGPQMGHAFTVGRLGDHRAARKLCDELLALDHPMATLLAQFPLGSLAADEGDLDDLERRCELLVPAARALGIDYYTVPVLLLATRLALARGDLDAAAALSAETDELVWSPVHELLIDVLLTAGEIAVAQRDPGVLDDLQERARSLVAQLGGPGPTAVQLMLDGWAAQLRDDLAGAERCFAAAGAGWDAAGRPAAATRAQADARKVAEALSRSAGATKSDPFAALTERELEVVALVAEGRTNREVAAALFLSEKTVRNYLSTIFTKLDVRRRSELAALVHTPQRTREQIGR